MRHLTTVATNLFFGILWGCLAGLVVGGYFGATAELGYGPTLFVLWFVLLGGAGTLLGLVIGVGKAVDDARHKTRLADAAKPKDE
jgi:hypothetical protein